MVDFLDLWYNICTKYGDHLFFLIVEFFISIRKGEFEFNNNFFSVFEVEGMVVEHIMNLSELTVTSAPTLSFTLDRSLFLIFFIKIKNYESFIKIVFKHPMRKFKYDSRFIVLQEAPTRQQIQ